MKVDCIQHLISQLLTKPEAVWPLKKKKLFTNTVWILFYLCSLTDPNQSVFLTWCGFYNNWSPNLCDEYTHISETQIWQLCLIFANNRFPLQPVESWAHKERKQDKLATAPCSGKQNPRALCCWSTQKTKPPSERKWRKTLCAQGVNCRCSVPNKKENRRHNPKCFLHTLSLSHSLTHSLTQNKILICW